MPLALIACAAFAVLAASFELPFVPGLGLGDELPDKILDAFKQAWEAQGKIGVDDALMQHTRESLMRLDVSRKEQNYQAQHEKNQKLKDKLVASAAKIEEKMEKLQDRLTDEMVKNVELVSDIDDAARPYLTVLATGVSEEPTSVVDFSNSMLSVFPIQSESLKLDAKYYSFVGNLQDVEAQSAAMESHIKGEFSSFGRGASVKASNAATAQHASQMKKTRIDQTVVYTASATHANARKFEPLKFDVDRLLEALLRKEGKEVQLAKSQNFEALQNCGASITVITGAATGSCMVGMVHYVKDDDLKGSQTVAGFTASSEFEAHGNFGINHVEGGISGKVSAEGSSKNMNSNSQVLSDAYLYAIGAMPTIKADSVIQLTSLLDSDPAKDMQLLMAARKANEGGAALGDKMLAMKGTQMENFMSKVIKGTEQKNKVVDANTLMEALDNFLALVRDPKTLGAPLKFYTTKINGKEAARLYYDRYQDEIEHGIRQNHTDL